MIESERDLQDYFLKLLENNSFNFIEIKNEDELIANFKKQFELFNNISLTDSEFSDIYNYLINDVSFDKLMEGHDSYSFMDLDDFNSNIFQVLTHVIASLFSFIILKMFFLKTCQQINLIKLLKKSNVDYMIKSKKY